MQVSFTEVELVDMILKTPKSFGSWNMFIKLNDQVGLKISQSEEHRDGNYARQEKAAKTGHAPDVYGKTEVFIKGVKYYGYFTEVVEVPDYDNQIYREQIEALRKWVESHIMGYWGDTKPSNCGIKNNRLVIIDMDDLDSVERHHSTTSLSYELSV